MSFLRNIFLIMSLAVCVTAVAQPDRRDVRKGNRDFRKESFKEAEIDYRKALVKDSLSFAANYNLAGTLYRLGDMNQARMYLDTLKNLAPGSPYAADYYYNSGNAAAGVKDWQAAVASYMQSLLRNPGDIEAKENYIYARKMLENQQQNGGDNGQNDRKQNNKDNQDGQNDDKDKNEEQDNDGQDRQPQGGQDDNNRQGGEQDRPRISPQAAQQMLQAIQAKEKETQDKVNKEKADALKSRQKEKNW